jgi:DNA-directed RNA polymerase subunit M/transcription elongation factor TFIIS
VGSVKRCKNQKCSVLFIPDWKDKNVLYCPTCRELFVNRNKQNTYRMRHESAKVGNSKQDSSILKFLKNKKKIEDNRYSKLYGNH